MAFNRGGPVEYPCKDCKSRYEACWMHCVPYLEKKKEQKAYNESERKRHESNNTFSERKLRIIWKNKRNSRNRKHQGGMGFE